MLNANLSTKADIAAIQSDIATVKADLEVKIANVQADLEAKNASLEANLNIKISNSQASLLKWMFGAMIAQGGIIVTLVTLL